MNSLDIIRERGRAYRKDHPAYIRQNKLPMIDLTRNLPSLEERLTPTSRHEQQAPTVLHDTLAALALAGMVIAAVYLIFGL